MKIYNPMRARMQAIPLPTANDHTEWELAYLHEFDGAAGGPTAAQKDVRLWQAVELMCDQLGESVVPEVAFQYSETFAALNRMRKAAARPEFALRV
jgi:hypothetical protein